MLIALYGERSILTDLSATITWRALVGGSHGQADVYIPRASPVWFDDIVDERGGFLVEVPTAMGVWRGIADTPTWDPSGLRFTAQAVSQWASIRLVGQRVMYSATAGQIVRRAYCDALAGLALVPITLGAVLNAPPIIPIFEFNRQSLQDVLAELSGRTGHEWELDDRLRLNWLPSAGRYREDWLVDDGRLFQSLRLGALSDVAAEVIQIDQYGRTFTARNAAAQLLWPAQRVVQS